MTEKKAPLTAAEEKELRVRNRISAIISDGYDYMYERFDKLHTQDIHDDDVVAALRHYGEIDILDGYVEWGEIVVDREDDNTTMNPAVPDPGDAPSYDALNQHLANIKAFKAEANTIAPGTVQ